MRTTSVQNPFEQSAVLESLVIHQPQFTAWWVA